MSVFVAGCSEPEQPLDNLTLGEPFPSIVLTGLAGERVALDDYRGQVVLLNLWATWCEPCRREMPSLQALSDLLDAERFEVLGMAVDDDDHVVREYLIDKNIRFTSYIDHGRQIATETLGVTLFPYTLLIGRDGTLLRRIPGARHWDHPDVLILMEQAYDGRLSQAHGEL